jgi:sialidase-1
MLPGLPARCWTGFVGPSCLAGLVVLFAACGDPPPADSADGSLATDTLAVVAGLQRPQVLWTAGDAGYGIYRIPALLETKANHLLAFVEGRQSLSDGGDIDLLLRRSTDGGKTWEPTRVVVDAGPDTAGNPAPFVDPTTGRIWLPHCTNPADNDQDRRVWLTWSDDDGLSWAQPRDITPEVKPAGWSWYATGPGRSIALASGRLVIPANHVGQDGVGRSHVLLSDDHGQTWQVGGLAAPDTDESQVAELADGQLLLGSRYEGPERARTFSRSSDQGMTWGPLEIRPDLPDPHCQGSLLQTPHGLLLGHPATIVPIPRDHLTVRCSLDGGHTWPYARLIDPGPSAYSALAQLPTGQVAVLWESGEALPYDAIRFAVLDGRWLCGDGP